MMKNLMCAAIGGALLLGIAAATAQGYEAPNPIGRIPPAPPACQTCGGQQANGGNACPKCACEEAKKKAAELQAKIAGAYKPVFYNNDFSYLNDPAYNDWMLGDGLKQMNVGCWAVVDVGGQYRMRYHHEHNHRGLGLTGLDDDFLLHRTRLFANAKLGDYFRVYGEMLDAESNYENFNPRPIEVNRTEIQNLFLDVKLYENDNGAFTTRVGRQELIYGAQRYVSPLDWANTRRTFEGYKAFWTGDAWDVDAFYVRPMNVEPYGLDSPDYDQEFMGVYTTYKALEDQTLEFYYLGYNTPAFQYDTWGTRYLATLDQWLFEMEGAIQTGHFTGLDHAAGATTIGLGRNLDDESDWNPILWVYYDYAAGDDVIGNGFHHLFPLGHRYLGFMDLFGRRNIETVNVLLTMQPHKKVQFLAWYYYLWLENKNDVPYTVVMTPFNPGNRPRVAELGHELDLMATIALHSRASLILGYSHFFTGAYYEETPGVPTNDDADFFYTQLEFNF